MVLTTPRRQHLTSPIQKWKLCAGLVPAGLCLLAGVLVLSSAAARAQSGAWNVNADGNWSDTTKWLSGIVADGATNIADFLQVDISGTRTVTLDSARTIGTAIFGDASGDNNWICRTLNGSVLTMDNGASKPLLRSRHTVTVSVVLDGTNGIRAPDLASPGTVVLNATNIYTGNTEVGRHILKLGIANAIPTGVGYGNVVLLANYKNPTDTGKLDLNIFSPTINGLDSIWDPATWLAPYVYSSAGAGTSTLTVGNGDANGTFGGVIQNGTSRTLALTKIGSGTQTLTNANTYTGATIISGGTLKLSYGGSIANSASITLAAGATFDVGDVTAPPYLIGSGKTLIGCGGTGTIRGDLTLDSGALLTLTNAAGTPTMTVSSNLTLNANTTTVIVTGDPLFNGSYKLISKSGTGSVSGTPGSVTVGGVGIAGGGSANLSISSGELFLDVTGGASALEWGSGNGTWAVGTTGWGSGGGTAFVNGDAALFTDKYSTGNPTITLNTEVLPQGTIVNSTNNYTITGTGDIGGAGELRKFNTGALTLNVSNAYAGGTLLAAGTLNVKKAAALGDPAGTFTISGGTLDNTSGGPLSLTNYPQVWNGNFAFAGSSDLSLGTGAVALASTPTVTVNSNTLAVDGDISGTGFGLIKAGAGRLSLGGSNTFNGVGIWINEGEILVNHPRALSVNILTMPNDSANKILTLNGNSLTVANLTKSGSTSPDKAIIRNNHPSTGATLTVSLPTSGSSCTFCGTITDGSTAPLAVTKIGVGTWRVGTSGTGFCTYSGDTTVSGGTLQPGAADVFPHGAGKGNMVVYSPGTFDELDRSSILVNGLIGNGTVKVSDRGGLANGTPQVLTVGDGDASGAFSGGMNDANPDPGKKGKLTLVKIGTGTQTLSGTCDYSGTTTVSNGTLQVDGTLYATVTPAAVTVNAGATLDGSGTINGPVTVNAGGNIAAGDSPGILTLGNGLDLSPGGTCVWELAALKDDTDGTPVTDFDQIVLTGGTLQLDGSSKLRIQFTGTASAPDNTNSFWQRTNNWTIISASGAASAFASIQNGNYAAGAFSTSVQAGGIVLTFTPSPFSLSIAPGPGSNLTLNYTFPGGGASQFVLLQTNNIAAPTELWTRVQTNTSSPGTFTITPGAAPRQFYRIKSE